MLGLLKHKLGKIRKVENRSSSKTTSSMNSKELAKLNRDRVKEISSLFGIPEEKVPQLVEAIADMVKEELELHVGRRMITAMGIGAGVMALTPQALARTIVMDKDIRIDEEWFFPRPLPFSAMVYIDNSKVEAINWKGGLIDEGKSGVDDASVIQSALDVSVGSKVLIKDGEYYLNTGLAVNKTVELIGESMLNTKLIANYDDINTPLISIVGTEYNYNYRSSIKNIRLDGNNRNTPLLKIEYCTNFLCERLNIVNSAGKAVFIKNSNDSIFRDCIFNNLGSATYNGIETENADWITFDNCHLGSTTKGIYFNGKKIRLLNCRIELDASVSISKYLITFYDCIDSEIAHAIVLTKGNMSGLINFTGRCDGSKIIGGNFFHDTATISRYINIDSPQIQIIGANIWGEKVTDLITITSSAWAVSIENCPLLNVRQDDSNVINSSGNDINIVGNVMRAGGYNNSANAIIKIGGTYHNINNNIMREYQTGVNNHILEVTGADYNVIESNDLNADKITLVGSHTYCDEYLYTSLPTDGFGVVNKPIHYYDGSYYYLAVWDGSTWRKVQIS